MPQSRPWYKEFWPWFLLAILSSSVIMGTTFLVLSIRSFDGMVEDDYYKRGLAINQLLEQDQRAAELNLVASLRIDDVTGGVNIQLNGDARPERLLLELIFPTKSDRDQSITLEHVRGGYYSGQLSHSLEYRWYILLQPDVAEPAWRLRGEIDLPRQTAIELHPAVDSP